MTETRPRFNRDFREGAGAVRLVLETGKPFAAVGPGVGGQRGHAGERGHP
jgi:hypothetical protein